MGIWIRSQRKQGLFMYIGFYCEYNASGEISIIGCTINKEKYTLGSYSTLAKAKKVLDMIQNHQNKINYHKDFRIGVENAIATPNYEVFQMPQENEVQ